MYMNEQLFQRPGNATIMNHTVIGKRNYSKLSKWFGLLFAVIIVLIVSFSVPALGGEHDALAASSNSTKQTFEIEKGDTLWSIAVQHVREGQDVREYISEMKRINGLKTTLLQEGQVLLLP